MDVVRRSYRERTCSHKRRSECNRMLTRRPDYAPTILERRGQQTPPISREKFLIPRIMSGAQLMYIVRSRVELQPSQAIFLLCNNVMITASDTVGELYRKHANSEDGMLYITYTVENTFGAPKKTHREQVP